MQNIPSLVKFRLPAQVAAAGDSINDGSVVWPTERKLVELGTISLTKTERQAI